MSLQCMWGKASFNANCDIAALQFCLESMHVLLNTCGALGMYASAAE